MITTLPRTLRRGAAALALTAAPLALAAPPIDPDSPARPFLERAAATVDAIVALPDADRTFDNTIRALDDLQARLELDANMTMFLAYVSTDAGERERGQQVEEAVTNWTQELGRDAELFRAVEAYAATKPALQGEDARLLEHTRRDFRRAGMALDEAARAELSAIQREITRLSIEFETAIRTDETVVPLAPEELAGMPEDWLATIPRAGGMLLVGMSYPEFLPVLDLCPSEATRAKCWLAYKRRGGRANVARLERLLALRAESAALLGYDHAADYEIEVRMAGEAEKVLAFYDTLRPLVRAKARADWAELLDAKRRETGDASATLRPWDTAYYTNVLMREKYAVDVEEIRAYFPLHAVMDGLFSITQSLYGITYRDVTDRASAKGLALWHDDVRLFEVHDDATGTLLGHFLIDLHPRENKFGHAAQWGLAQHKVWADGTTTLPLAALVCNFTKPTADKPSLMSHDEVETFFHEFGHCLHTILSEATHWRFAGTGVERDFVEAPSQMFENWVWNAEVLATFARHYETGETFPTSMLEGMMAARNLGSGMLAERQFFYGTFDLRCHLDPAGAVDTIALAHELWGEEGDGVELYEQVPETWFHASFGHLTGYQAGYYGYQWSLVYASDMFRRFRELGMLDPEAGLYYRRMILARGGTKDGIDLVRDYLGREPDLSAYLEHLGLETEGH